MNKRLSARYALAGTVSLLVASLGIAACFSDRAPTDNTTTLPPGCSAPANAAGATVVAIQSVAFTPTTVHVKAGGAVVWVNCEPTPISHTSTSDAAGWNSGNLTQNQSYSRVFPVAGSFAYHCDVHPFMKATVVVN